MQNTIKFDVTVMKIGSLTIEADTAEDAMLFVKTHNENDINWIGGFEVTDAKPKDNEDPAEVKVIRFDNVIRFEMEL